MIKFFYRARYSILKIVPIVTGLGYQQSLNRIFRDHRLKSLSKIIVILVIKFIRPHSGYYIFFGSLLNQLKKDQFPNSQLLQEIFVLAYYDHLELDSKLNPRSKVVIDIGAANPEKFSNSNVLIKQGFKAFLVEPNPEFLKHIYDYYQNTEISIIPFGISSNSSLTKLISASYLSSLNLDGTPDQYSDLRKKISRGKTHDIHTISPKNFVDTNKIPSLFVYLSIDIEGSDLDVLRSWPFEKSRPIFISIEHNFNPDVKDEINKKLENAGYFRVLERISSLDSFFILKDIQNFVQL